jgi:PAS domain S-box-containing protein
VAPSEIEKTRQLFASVLQGTSVENFEVPLIGKANRLTSYEVSASFIRDEELNNPYVLIVVHDISARKKAEELLRFSEEKFATAFHTSPDAVNINRMTDGMYIEVNEGFTELMGYTKDDVAGKTSTELHIWADPNDRKRLVEGLRESGTVRNLEARFRRKNGDIGVGLMSARIITLNNEPHILSITRDITQRKADELQLVAAKEKAEELNRLKNNFFAGMSHELRTPLMGILGYSDILNSLLEDEQLKNMAATIQNSGTRLLETLNLILNFSKLEAQKITPEYSLVNVSQAAADVVRTFEALAKRKGLDITLHSHPALIEAFTDHRFLNEILNNLVNNAIKFTPKGSVKVIIESDASNLQIKVIDTGIGIAKEKYDVIFEEFRQESEGLSRNFEGTGLGLSLTQKYVEMMNGTLSVESEVGAGSAFTITLPLIQTIADSSPADKQTTPSAQPAPSRQKLSILLVENDETNSDVIISYLKHSHSVKLAKDGITAIACAAEDQYDLILMDINLGKGMSGAEAAQKIKEMKQYADTPIIAVTAFAMLGDKEEFLAGGCTHYIAKPFRRRELLGLIDSIMREKESTK